MIQFYHRPIRPGYGEYRHISMFDSCLAVCKIYGSHFYVEFLAGSARLKGPISRRFFGCQSARFSGSYFESRFLAGRSQHQSQGLRSSDFNLVSLHPIS